MTFDHSSGSPFAPPAAASEAGTSASGVSVPSPRVGQLAAVALQVSPPFLAFGFMDNFIMLVAGDFIDQSFGVVLGLSALAAAGLGNMVSDVVGLTTSGWIESASGRLGLPNPRLTRAQQRLRITRIVMALARAVAVCIGCLIGMTPLLWRSEDLDSNLDRIINSSEFVKNVRRVFNEHDVNKDQILSGSEIKVVAQKFLTDAQIQGILNQEQKKPEFGEEFIHALINLYSEKNKSVRPLLPELG